MRTPLWESSAGALAALLNSRTALTVFDLYTVTLADASVYRWSAMDVPVTVNGNTWVLGPGVERSRTRSAIGVSVDTLDVKVVADDTVLVNGTPILQYIAKGGLRNARLQVDRAYMGDNDAAITGVLLWFTGRVAETTADRAEARLTIKSSNELLDVMVPREVYQPGCLNTLYDSACGVNRASFTVTGSATGASDATRTSFPHALGQANGYFDLGVVKFTSGPNVGISRTVKRHVSGTLTVLNPFPFAVANGHAFSIVPGCDKTRSTCINKFARGITIFRGHPYIPVPETVL
ncbi:DUF2163 domain-containing protein [Methylibium sp.]|uniref:DUF2163 domain-containing protein n=1 Tax=Methylibium sp. TaxID=2067992 RepID=UPI003D14AD18